MVLKSRIFSQITIQRTTTILINKSTCSYLCLDLQTLETTSSMRKLLFQQEEKHEALINFLSWSVFLFSSSHFSLSLLSFSLSLNVPGLSISVISIPTSLNCSVLGFWEGFSFCRAVRFPASCVQYFRHIQKVQFFNSTFSGHCIMQQH